MSDSPAKDQHIHVYFEREEEFLEILSRFPECKSLRKLDLVDCPVKKDYISKLVEGVPLLEQLTFQCGSFEPGVFEVLQRAHRLKHLKVSTDKITSADVGHIAGLPYLESFTAEAGNIPEGGVEELRRLMGRRVQIVLNGRVVDFTQE